MIQTRENNACYLTFEQSIIVTLVPATFFLLNGIIVHFLKTLEALSVFYLVLPLICFLLLFLFNKRYSFITPAHFLKYLPVYLLPVIFAAVHGFFYGTSVGGDSTSYFTNPIYTFYASGNFSHSELPFIAYGEQPLASYWLPYNSEFVFTAIGSLFGLHFIQIAGLMHFVSNYLFGLAIISILLRFMSLFPAILLFLLFLCTFYATSIVNNDLPATSVFRGFENKGLIWGYFFWACINLLIPRSEYESKSKFFLLSGLILGASGFLVSGNAVFLIFPIVVLAIGAALGLNFKSIVFQLLGLLASLLACLFVFKLFETTNVYDVVTADLTYRAPEEYVIQSRGFHSPIWLWLLAIIASLLVAKLNFRLSIQFFIFIVFSKLIQSETFYDLFFTVAPEFTLNFWRLAILMSPFVPILFATAYLLSNVSVSKQLITCLVASIFLGVSMTLSLIEVPGKSPFRQNKVSHQLLALAELCKPDSLILAGRRIATRLPVLQPSYQYLVGKEYFLNWQVANLSDQPDVRKRALTVRDASLYISVSPTTKRFGDNETALIKVLEDEKPDAVFLRSKRITPENEILFSSYRKQSYRGVTVFTKDDKCDMNFKERVEQFRQQEE